MIVRDEAHVIERCLKSVKPFITSWCIVDTGSLDDTADIVRKTLSGIPGTLHERPWVSQEHNRNEALALAYESRPDYVFLIDADEELVTKNDSWPSDLTADYYSLWIELGSIRYIRHQLLSTRVQWSWQSTGKRCRFHPFLRAFPYARSHVVLDGFTTLARPDGASWKDSNKYKKLVPLVDLDIADEPTNARLRYYCAQNCENAGELGKALELYTQRSKMVGFDQETWMSLLNIAKLKERLNHFRQDVISAYLDAHRFRPSRAESLFHLSRYCRDNKDWELAKLFSQASLEILNTSDILFVEHEVYSWRRKNELACALWRLGDKEGAKDVFASIDVPSAQHSQQFQKNAELILGTKM